RRDPVGFMHRRAPAIVSAYAHLFCQEPHPGMPGNRKLFFMGSAVKLCRAVRKHAHLKRLSLRLTPESLSLFIRHLKPAHARTVSALLGNQITRYICLCRILIDSKSCSFHTVHIIFFRAPAVITEMMICFFKL